MLPIDALISLVLALITFGIGASLQLSDFTKVFRYPKALFLGLGLQLFFLPLFVLLVTCFLPLDPLWKVGLFILALCPGGSTSNFISYLIGAEVALSIALTTLNSFIILFTIPLLSNWALGFYLDSHVAVALPFGATMQQVFLLTLLPAFGGVLFNQLLPQLSVRLRQPLKYINIVLLGAVFAIKFFASEESGGSGITNSDILAILPAALLIHFGSMFFSYYVSRRVILSNTHATTIGIEVGLQNTTLALLVTGTLLMNNEMSQPVLVYALFSFFTTLGFAFWASRRKQV